MACQFGHGLYAQPVAGRGGQFARFARILSARIVQHLCEVGPDLLDDQFGLREGRSKVDATMRLRAVTEAAVKCGGVLLKVSLNIANAFKHSCTTGCQST